MFLESNLSQFFAPPSFGLTGVSVGIIIPCMPLLMTQLGVTPHQFGLIVAAFGVSKLLGNIPSGYLVETCE
jgi:MFS family permease